MPSLSLIPPFTYVMLVSLILIVIAEQLHKPRRKAAGRALPLSGREFALMMAALGVTEFGGLGLALHGAFDWYLQHPLVWGPLTGFISLIGMVVTFVVAVVLTVWIGLLTNPEKERMRRQIAQGRATIRSWMPPLGSASRPPQSGQRQLPPQQTPLRQDRPTRPAPQQQHAQPSKRMDRSKSNGTKQGRGHNHRRGR